MQNTSHVGRVCSGGSWRGVTLHLPSREQPWETLHLELTSVEYLTEIGTKQIIAISTPDLFDPWPYIDDDRH